MKLQGNHQLIKFLKSSNRRRNGKGRAQSFDESVRTVSVDSLTATSNADAEPEPNILNQSAEQVADCSQSVARSQQPSPDDSKHDIVMRNRLAALQAQQLMFGEEHPDVLFMSLHNLGKLHYRRGEHTAAERVFQEQARRIAHSTMPKIPSEIEF